MRTIGTLHLTLILAALTVAPASAQVTTDAKLAPTPMSQVLRAAVADHESERDRQGVELVDLLVQDAERRIAADNVSEPRRLTSDMPAPNDAGGASASTSVDSMLQENGGGLGTVTIGVGALIVGLLILILVT